MLRKIALGCLVPLVVFGAAGWWGYRALTYAAPPQPRQETADIGTVEIKVTETGTIEPLKKVEVKSKVAGRLARLLVDEGTPVKAGMLLAEIDPTEINSQVAQYKAQLAGARARLTQALRSVEYQKQQTTTGVEVARQALASAQTRLQTAQAESRQQPALTDADIDQAKATLQSAIETLNLTKNATHPQALVQAQSGYDDARAGEENARRNLKRQETLRDKGFVSDQVVDTARAELAAATARLDQARKRLELVAEQNRLELAAAEAHVAEARAALRRAEANRIAVDTKKREVEVAAAAVRQAKSQLEAAEASVQQDRMRRDDVDQARSSVLQLENVLRENQVHQFDTRLVAPMDGVVTRRYVEQGELITSGVSTFSSGTPVLQIADLSRMLVKMTVNEVDVYKIRPGLPVEISVDGAKGELFHGHVSKVAPAAGSATEAGSSGAVIRFAVEVQVDRPDPRLRPGMSARCTIVIARRTNVLRVPKQCISHEGGQTTVRIVTMEKKDGRNVEKLTPRKVVVGLEGDTYAEIVSGLRSGEKLKPGDFSGPKRRGVQIDFGGGDNRDQNRDQNK
jgi:HlyD family secretion protein